MAGGALERGTAPGAPSTQLGKQEFLCHLVSPGKTTHASGQWLASIQPVTGLIKPVAGLLTFTPYTACVTDPKVGHLPIHSKSNLLTPGCGEGKCNIYCKASDLGSSKEKGQLMLKRPNLSDWFQGRDFKGTVKGVTFRVTDKLMHNQLPNLPYSNSHPENYLIASL